MTHIGTTLPRTWALAALLALATLALSSGLTTPPPAAAEVPLPAPGTVYVFARLNVDGVLTVQNGAITDGAPVVVINKGNQGYQGHEAWKIVDTSAGDGFYQLRNIRSNLCLEIPGAVAPAGTAAQQYRCDPNYKNQPNQLWQVVRYDWRTFTLRNKASGLSLQQTAQGSVIQSTTPTPWATGTMQAQQLCTGPNYGGACLGTLVPGELQNLIKPVVFSDLSQTHIGSRTVSSVGIFHGSGDFMAALFSGTNFSGTCWQFGGSDPNLADNGATFQQMPDDKAQSAFLGRGCPAGDVELCQHANFDADGSCITVTQNIQEMASKNDMISSIYVKAGRTVALYRHNGFEGTCETFTGADANLADNYIGDNQVSSVWLDHRCDQDVQLCEHNDLGGRCVSFRSDSNHLGYTDIGNDTASSVRVPAGWQISVHSDADMRGLVDLFNGPVTKNFGVPSTSAPNDSASSLDIRQQPSTSNPCAGLGCMVQP